jgi:hypothetical protein
MARRAAFASAGQGFIFSTGDGRDPNDNGRRYWAVIS